eukprot:3313356-Amphidinium_carterae.2
MPVIVVMFTSSTIMTSIRPLQTQSLRLPMAEGLPQHKISLFFANTASSKTHLLSRPLGASPLVLRVSMVPGLALALNKHTYRTSKMNL